MNSSSKTARGRTTMMARKRIPCTFSAPGNPKKEAEAEAEAAEEEEASEEASEEEAALLRRCDGLKSRRCSKMMMTMTMMVASHVWRQGPCAEAGAVVRLSDRPSLCMSLMDDTAAVGSSDHAIYTVHIPSATLRNQLYHSRRNITSVGLGLGGLGGLGGSGGLSGLGGHSEWVTAVSHLHDGRLLSGGMDSKLFLWNSSSTPSRCRELKGGNHTASISGVKAFTTTNNNNNNTNTNCSSAMKSMVVSSSYDKSLMLWDVGRDHGKHVATMRGHVGAVMAFVVVGGHLSSGARVVSGGRDGGVIAWDVGDSSASLLVHRKSAHRGHATSLEVLKCGVGGAQELYLSGGQDGVLKVWDCRANSPVHSQLLHSSTKAQGALSCISVSQSSSSSYPLIVTGGADKLMKVLDPRSSFQVVHTLTGHRDFIYSLFASGSFAWSGSGDGSLLVHDITSGECLYGLGASENGAAIRCIDMAVIKDKEYIVCTGDDGNVMIYSASSRTPSQISINT